MKNIFSFFSRESLSKSLPLLTSRFPIPTFLVLVTAGLVFFMVNTESEDMTLAKLIVTGGVTFFLSICTALFLERREKSTPLTLLSFLPIVYGVFFFYTVRISEDFVLDGVVYSLLHLTGFIAGVFFAPYIARLFDGKDENYEYVNYFSRVAWTFLMSAIVGVSLLLLGYIAISSVLALFDLYSYFSDFKIYANWAIVSLGIVAPLYGLIQMPKVGDMNARSYEVNRFFSFLIRYVAVPAIFVYFAILYAYSVKVLMNFSDWPKGMICYMVVGFSTFGYLTYIFSKPYEDTRFVSIFRRFFPYAVIPQVAMLAYAISLRIGQYDITMNRYFVVIFGAWLLIVSLYLIFRTRKSLSFIVASLSVISLLISVGPWSVFSLPFARQEARLIRNLETAKILQNGSIVPLAKATDISKELSNEIASGISYLCDFDNCERIKLLFPEQVELAKKKAYENWKTWNNEASGAVYEGKPSQWEIESTITENIKVEISYGYDGNSKNTTAVWYYATKEPLYPVDVKGYTRIVSVLSPQSGVTELYPYVSLDMTKMMIVYHQSEKKIFSYPLALPAGLLDGDTVRELSKGELTFDVTGSGVTLKVLLQNLSVRNPAYTGSIEPYMSGVSGIALVKE